MNIRSIEDLDLKGKKVLVRVDFNVPLKEGKVTDDTRIRRALPTLKYILKQEGASLILMSHLGRPSEAREPEFSLNQIKDTLSELVGVPVIMAPDCIGPEVEKMANGLESNTILLLENTRYHKGETKNDPSIAKGFASLADVYVNDAFGTAHRAHASTEGVAKLIPSAAGYLMTKECTFFDQVVESPARPMMAVIGGSKVSSKIDVLESLLPKCDTFVIGGGMAYTFLKVQGKSIGNSLFEEPLLDTAKNFLDKANARGTTVILPLDHVVASEFSETATAEPVDGQDIPDGKIAMDIGPKTVKAINEKIKTAKTVVWNGPMGVFEFDTFAKGTLDVANMVARP